MSCCSNQSTECMTFEVRKACADDIPCIHGMIQVSDTRSVNPHPMSPDHVSPAGAGQLWEHTRWPQAVRWGSAAGWWILELRFPAALPGICGRRCIQWGYSVSSAAITSIIIPFWLNHFVGHRKPIGYALAYFSYSTWVGRSLHLEDLYVQPFYRFKGVGRLIIQKVNIWLNFICLIAIILLYI